MGKQKPATSEWGEKMLSQDLVMSVTWRTDEPPKDGRCILGQWGEDEYCIVRYKQICAGYHTFMGWVSGVSVFSDDPDRWAEINE